MADMLQGVFEILKDPQKFNSVFIDEVGNIAWDIDPEKDSSVCWNNRIDICKDALYLDSEPLPDEIKAMKETEKNSTAITHDAIDWD